MSERKRKTMYMRLKQTTLRDSRILDKIHTKSQ